MALESNPYPGPRPLERKDSIYGRDVEKWRLYHFFNSHRIVLLVSPSGAGKSSLLQAGLIPILEQNEFDVWPTIRVGAPADDIPEGANRFALSVMESLEPEGDSRTPVAKLAGMDLLAYAESRPCKPGALPNKVLIFDQFEEVLTLDRGNLAAKRDFFAQLGKLLRHDKYWAIFAMREEYLAALDPYRKEIPTHLTYQFWLDLLSSESAKSAIEKPATDRNVQFASGVVDGLAEALAGSSPFVEPVHLQAVCHSVWENRKAGSDIAIPEKELKKIVTNALGTYYDNALKRICGEEIDKQRKVREWIGDTLILPSGVRAFIPNQTAVEALTGDTVEALGKAYLIREEKQTRGHWVELSHDTLIKPVRASNEAWFDKNLNSPQKRARLWARNRRPGNLLSVFHAFWSGASTADEIDYVNACRVRARGWLLGLLLAIVLPFGSVMYLALQAQNDSRVLAAAAEAAAESTTIKRLGIKLALLALEKADTTEAEEALYHSVESGRDPGMSAHKERAISIAFSADGKFAATGGADNKLFLWNFNPVSEMFEQSPETPGPAPCVSDCVVNSVAFSPDGAYLAAAWGKTVFVWKRNGLAPPALQFSSSDFALSVAFSADGEWLAAGFNDGSVRLFAAKGQFKEEAKLDPPDGFSKARHVAFSPDNRSLAAAYADGAGIIQIASKKALQPSCGTVGSIVTIAWNPKSSDFAIGHENGLVEVCAADTQKQRYRFFSPGELAGLTYSPDGKTIYTAGKQSQARAWRDGQPPLVLDKGGSNRNLAAVAIVPVRNQVAFLLSGYLDIDPKTSETVTKSGVRFYDLHLKDLKDRAEGKLEGEKFCVERDQLGLSPCTKAERDAESKK